MAIDAAMYEDRPVMTVLSRTHRSALHTYSTRPRASMEGVLQTHVIPDGASHAGTTVHICRDATAAADLVCDIVAATARAAAEQRGHASVAVPGGSVLKMLAGLTDQVMFGCFDDSGASIP